MPDSVQPSGAVFLSYAREDTQAARRIADALRGFGVEVWFDQNELRGGDAWDQKIRGQIRNCALFLPIISGRTQARGEGYFRREWKLAVERTHDMAASRAFLVPVAIDETAESSADVPDEFMRVQWTRLDNGMPTPEFVSQVKRLLEAPRPAAAPAPIRPSPSDARATPLSPKGRSWWPLAVIGAAALVAAAIFATRKPTPSPAATQPAASPAPAPTPAKVDEKSIAVLPFTNMSEEKDSAFFADGVHEDILTNLALIGDLKVVSRTTVTQYRDSKKTLRQIGEELGVAYILEGSVRRAGNKVRVTGQLINARTDDHVWAKAYDRDLTDIFAIQAALAQEIAGALHAAITPQTQKYIERRPTEDPLAYDAFLKGRKTRDSAVSGMPAPLKQAEAYFQAAVDADPKFATAWGELAVTHALFVFWEIDGSPGRLAQGDAAIARALQLAPEAPDVIGQVGTYAYYAHRDYVSAIAQYQKLAQLKPNDPTVANSLALIQRRQGRWAESVVNSRKAVALDPGNISYSRNLIATLASGRRWPECLAEQRHLISLVSDKLTEEATAATYEFLATGSRAAYDAWLAGMPPDRADSPRVISLRKNGAVRLGDFAEFIRLDRIQPYFDGDGLDHSIQALNAAGVYLAEGDVAAARQRLGDFPAQLRARLDREPNNPRLHSDLGLMEAILGHPAEAVRLARQGEALLPESRDALDGLNFSANALIRVYTLTGDKDAALAGLAHVLRVPCQLGGTNGLRASPWFATLHSDPRWEALLKDPKNNAPLF